MLNLVNHVKMYCCMSRRKIKKPCSIFEKVNYRSITGESRGLNVSTVKFQDPFVLDQFSGYKLLQESHRETNVQLR